MRLFRYSSLSILLTMLCSLPAVDEAFQGWRSMELIKLSDGRVRGSAPSSSAELRFGDVNNDGHDNAILIKRRQSLIEWYAYVAVDQRQGLKAQHNANDLPLSNRFKRHEFRLECLPYDVVVLKPGRVAVIVGPPHYIEIYDYKKAATDQESWQLVHKLPLLRGEPLRHLPVLFAQQEQQLLLASNKGVQIIHLEDEPCIEWMRPRLETTPRRWFLSDLDGDGDRDLVKLFNSNLESVIWHINDNGFRPPQSIYDQKIRDAVVLDSPNAASDLYVLDAIGDALLRRYQLAAEAEQRFGLQRSLSLPSAEAAWTGVKIGGDPALLVCDTEHPQLLVYPYVKHNWGHALSFPCLDQVEAVYALPHDPQTVLLKRKNEGELFKSSWQDGRFSFPKPWRPNEHQAKTVKILQMGRVANGVESQLWWTQQQDDDLVLFVWQSQWQEPKEIRFAGKAKKVEQALWLGGQRVLTKAQFKRDGILLTLNGDKIEEEKGAHLKNVNMKAYRPAYNLERKVVPVRLHEGVLQWLDDRLHALDQVMLEDGLSIDDFMYFKDTPFVLEGEGMHLVSLAKDDGGVLRSKKRFDIPGGYALRLDPVLGLFVQEPAWICRLDRGQSWSLQLQEHIDTDKSKAAGVARQYFHRLHEIQVAGASGGAFIVSDDAQHRLSLYARKEKATEAAASWQVFDDGSYPYGEQRRKNVRPEPRRIYSAHFDHDKEPDLFLLCHDRLIVYLSEEL